VTKIGEEDGKEVKLEKKKTEKRKKKN